MCELQASYFPLSFLAFPRNVFRCLLPPCSPASLVLPAAETATPSAADGQRCWLALQLVAPLQSVHLTSKCPVAPDCAQFIIIQPLQRIVSISDIWIVPHFWDLKKNKHSSWESDFYQLLTWDYEAAAASSLKCWTPSVQELTLCLNLKRKNSILRILMALNLIWIN